jgi:trehalose synthase
MSTAAHHLAEEVRPVALQQVRLREKSIMDYAPIVGDDAIDEIEELARPLHGMRVAHISATSYGGGVAELLHTLVPLMCSAGLDADWFVLTGSEAFFEQTKRMHNALQGMELPLTPELEMLYLDTNIQNAASLTDGFDFVVVHDPQPAPLRMLRPGDGGSWIWRCHIDLTDANAIYWHFLRPFVREYDAAIFTMTAYVKPDLGVSTVAIIPPAIDPLSPKNAHLSSDQGRAILAHRGIDPDRPLLVQVSRYDPWKDPTGVIDVYRRVRKKTPRLQLAMLGALAHDDPEGVEYYQRTKDYAGADPDIHILTNLGGDLEVNAFQRRATVILQKSIREGFGMTVTEGLWKARPVVATNVGGIPLQIEDGVSGYLVESTEECVARVGEILRAPQAAAEMGKRGQDVVRRNFLATTHLCNYLKLFADLTQHGQPAPSSSATQPSKEQPVTS